MDPITHGLLGAATAQALFGSKLGRKAAIIGALAAMAPDLDIFIRSSSDPLFFYIYHRHFTHSLFFAPFGGLIIAGLFLLFFKSFRAKKDTVIFASITAFFTHGLLDACTSYGTLLYWPWSIDRVAWDIIPIVDPIFTLILLIGVILSVKRMASKPAWIALFLAGLYLCFGVWQHHRVMIQQLNLVKERKQVREQGRVIPQIGQLMVWRSVYMTKEQIYVDTIKAYPWRSAEIIPGIVVKRFTENDVAQKIRENPAWLRDLSVFSWFSDGYIGQLLAHPLILADMRFVLGMNPPTVLWTAEFPLDDREPHVHLLMNVVIRDKNKTVEQGKENSKK